MKPKLIIVGAGPGEADLITVKGVKAIQQAEVILYDALANEELLELAKSDALKVNVGKRGGKPSFSQDKINQLIVSYALIYGRVVRLKGGDPFVFGRGLEEVEFAEKNGVATEIVPGISSATGLTALNKISLTERGVSDGFWVLTASLKGNTFNKDIALAAYSNSTLVILMGVNKINVIAQQFKKAGRNNLPLLVIENGSLPNERLISSSIDRIEEDAIKQSIKSPAIIVIGEVVRQKRAKSLALQTINYLN